MARDMSRDEWHAFVLHGTRTAKVAVPRKDGSPHVAPVWVVLDGDDVIFTTGADTIKGKSLLRDGRIALCIDDDTPPFAFVIIEGVATISRDPDELLRWATAIGGRYMGADQAEAFGRRNAAPSELLVRVTPARVIAKAGISD